MAASEWLGPPSAKGETAVAADAPRRAHTLPREASAGGCRAAPPRGETVVTGAVEAGGDAAVGGDDAAAATGNDLGMDHPLLAAPAVPCCSGALDRGPDELADPVGPTAAAGGAPPPPPLAPRPPRRFPPSPAVAASALTCRPRCPVMSRLATRSVVSGRPPASKPTPAADAVRNAVCVAVSASTSGRADHEGAPAGRSAASSARASAAVRVRTSVKPGESTGTSSNGRSAVRATMARTAATGEAHG